MIEALMAVVALVAGAGLGAMFFGGLWWTIQKGVTSKQPALWFSVSLFLRFTIAIGGFYCIGNNHYQRLLLCLTGFATTGIAATWFTRQPVKIQIKTTQESSHAP